MAIMLRLAQRLLSGDIHVHKYGIDEKEHAEIIAEKLLLEQKLAELKEETVEERRSRFSTKYWLKICRRGNSLMPRL